MRSVLAALLLGVAASTSGTAQAHAALVKSAPGSRETLLRSPAVLTLKFNERVEPRFSTVSLQDAGGRPRVLGALRLSDQDPTQIELAVPDPLEPGTYTVRYRVLSQDGHVVEYGYQFRVTAPAGAND